MVFDKLNWDNPEKFITSLGIICLVLFLLYPLFVLYIVDEATTKYIGTELDISRTPNLSEEIKENISKIQNMRIELALGFVNTYKIMSIIFLIGGGILYFIGIKLWNKKDKNQKITRVNRKKKKNQR